MSEIVCLICNAQSPENALYCQQCGQPIRCQNCQEILLPTARACTKCGKLIPERAGNEHLSIGTRSLPIGYNQLEFHETPEGRDITAIVSNDAIVYIGDILPSLLGNRTKAYQSSSGEHQSEKQPDLVEVTSETPPMQPQLPAATSHPTPSEPGIWDIFHKTGDGALKQDISQLKASSKKDYTIRLVYLFLFAKRQLGEESVPRTDVYTILEDANLKDGNTARSLNSASGISFDGNDTLRLNLGGRQTAEQYIKDVFNSDLPDGWYPGVETHSTSTRPKKQNKKSADQQNSVDVEVAKWISHEGSKSVVDKVPHEKINELSMMDKTLLALYGISEAGVKQLVSVASIVRYLYKAFQVEVNPRTVSKTIYEEKKRKAAKASYLTSDGHGWEISPSGRKYIEKLLNLKQPQLVISDTSVGSNGAAQQ